MLFADLEKLKVIKEYNYQTFAVEIKLNINDAAAANRIKIKEAIKDLFEVKPAIAAQYHIELLMDDMNDEDFAAMVNLVTMVFFESFTLNGSRKRERRLDVPEKLKCAHISASLLKRAVNAQTFTDVFNLTIVCNGGYQYTMLDTKETVENE